MLWSPTDSPSQIRIGAYVVQYLPIQKRFTDHPAENDAMGLCVVVNFQ